MGLIDIVREIQKGEPDSSQLDLTQRNPIFYDWYNKSRTQRRKNIKGFLEQKEIDVITHTFSATRDEIVKGENIIVTFGEEKEYYIGISCHYDSIGPGANDNLSSVAVVLNLINYLKEEANLPRNIGVKLFLFDHEEIEVKGSESYVEKYNEQMKGKLLGLINLDLTGTDNANTLIIYGRDSLEEGISKAVNYSSSQYNNLAFPQIQKRNTDHISFEGYDAITLETASQQDSEVFSRCLKRYSTSFFPDYKYLHDEIRLILRNAPMYRNMHTNKDVVEKLSEETMRYVSGVVKESIKYVDEKYNEFIKEDLRFIPLPVELTVEN